MSSDGRFLQGQEYGEHDTQFEPRCLIVLTPQYRMRVRPRTAQYLWEQYRSRQHVGGCDWPYGEEGFQLFGSVSLMNHYRGVVSAHVWVWQS